MWSAYTTACVNVHRIDYQTFPKVLRVAVFLGDKISSDFPFFTLFWIVWTSYHDHIPLSRNSSYLKTLGEGISNLGIPKTKVCPLPWLCTSAQSKGTGGFLFRHSLSIVNRYLISSLKSLKKKKDQFHEPSSPYNKVLLLIYDHSYTIKCSDVKMSYASRLTIFKETKIVSLL